MVGFRVIESKEAATEVPVKLTPDEESMSKLPLLRVESVSPVMLLALRGLRTEATRNETSEPMGI